MSLAERVRGCDSFGAPVRFNYKRNESHKTIGGGFASLCLQVVVLAFFVMRLIAILNNDDSKISSYLIIESRNEMKEPLSFAEHSMQLYFGFQDKNFKFVPLDPKIGSFTLRSSYQKSQGD